MNKYYLAWLPAVLVMCIIFYFSAKPATQSSESSIVIAEKVLTAYENITENHFTQPEREKKLDTVHHLIRKGAHFSEYACLAVAISYPIWIKKRNKKIVFFLSVLISALYAITDEVHQYFVPGRSCEVRDVLIDSSGAILGAVNFLVIIKIPFQKLFKKKELKKEG